MEKLREYAREYGIELSEEQLNQFNTYYEMLIEKNKVMNLTAITEKEDVMVKHFADSIAVASCYDFVNQEVSLIDVGTGAGFPGIPLKIAFPNLKVTLLDSLNKRVSFLQEVIDELRLEEIQAVRRIDVYMTNRDIFHYLSLNCIWSRIKCHQRRRSHLFNRKTFF